VFSLAQVAYCLHEIPKELPMKMSYPFLFAFFFLGWVASSKAAPETDSGNARLDGEKRQQGSSSGRFS